MKEIEKDFKNLMNTPHNLELLSSPGFDGKPVKYYVRFEYKPDDSVSFYIHFQHEGIHTNRLILNTKSLLSVIDEEALRISIEDELEKLGFKVIRRN